VERTNSLKSGLHCTGSQHPDGQKMCNVSTPRAEAAFTTTISILLFVSLVRG
jgi:hypothetical protein